MNWTTLKIFPLVVSSQTCETILFTHNYLGLGLGLTQNPFRTFKDWILWMFFELGIYTSPQNVHCDTEVQHTNQISAFSIVKVGPEKHVSCGRSLWNWE